MKQLISATVLILVLALPGDALAADGNGVIEGQIVNSTEGGSNVAALNVTFERYFMGEFDDSQIVVTDEDGGCIIEGLATGPEYHYRFSLYYQDAEYFSEYVSFVESETIAYVAIVVYDATTSSEAISIAQAHSIIQVEGNELYITDVYAFSNSSDLTWVGEVDVENGQGITMRFPLPAEAMDLSFGSRLMECCAITVAGGFAHTMPVLPGMTDVMFSYSVPYTDDNYIFDRSIYYPTAGFDLVIQGVGVEIESRQLAVSQSISESGVSYTLGKATGLSQGDLVMAQITGLPKIGGDSTVPVVIGTLAVLIVGSIIFIVMRKRTGASSAGVPVASEVTVEDGANVSIKDERYRLLVLIGELDDDFENGKLTEDAYRRQRDVAKAHLRRLM